MNDAKKQFILDRFHEAQSVVRRNFAGCWETRCLRIVPAAVTMQFGRLFFTYEEHPATKRFSITIVEDSKTLIFSARYAMLDFPHVFE